MAFQIIIMKPVYIFYAILLAIANSIRSRKIVAPKFPPSFLLVFKALQWIAC